MSGVQVLHVPADHPLNRLTEALKKRIVVAQTNLLAMEFTDSYELCQRAMDDIKIAIKPPRELKDEPPTTFGDLSSKELNGFFSKLLEQNRIPAQAIPLHTANLSHRVHLIRAFDRPDAVVDDVGKRVVSAIKSFPKSADDIRCGRNPGDVLDPYILAATQILLSASDLEHTVSATVEHKALMKIEGLMGQLHQNVIGAMRGNIRAPEPGGKKDKEKLDMEKNPFPGVDIVQPPLAVRPIRLHQVKNKTGSEKGGSGKRLGDQLKTLTDLYGGEAYFDAIVGNTLDGHRTMTGVMNAAPEVIVLVGEAAFRELTCSSVGPQLLLNLYRSAFEVAASQTGYALESVIADIYMAFKERSEELGEGFLETVLHDATYGTPAKQDSRHYVGSVRRRKSPKTSK